jgi:hypothetical protein
MQLFYREFLYICFDLPNRKEYGLKKEKKGKCFKVKSSIFIRSSKMKE